LTALIGLTPASAHFSWLAREPEALAVAEEGLAVLPGNPTLVRARAHAVVRLGRHDDAEGDLRRLIDAGASISGQDHLILGSIALGRGDADLAAREFHTALSRLSTSAFPLAIGRAYLEAGRAAEGLVHLDRTVAIESS
jgi:predicted Zn-dependent protease